MRLHTASSDRNLSSDRSEEAPTSASQSCTGSASNGPSSLTTSVPSPSSRAIADSHTVSTSESTLP
jgi:hypothetical protein